MPEVPAKPATPVPAKGDATTRVTRALLDAARASLRTEPAEIRPWVATNLAAMLLAVGRDEEADLVLAEARRQAALARDPLLVARVEVALAMAAEVRDDDARANEHLALAARDGLAADTSFHAWTITSRLARRQGTNLPDFAGDPEASAEARLGHSVGARLVAEGWLERATSARQRGDVVLAGDLLQIAARRVTETAAPRLLAMLEEEEGLYAFATLDLGAGERRLRRAVELFAENGLARDEGRALLELATLIARHPGRMRGESASAAFGRAQTVLGGRATWRDRLAIQNGFRDGGRRVIDRALTDGTVSRIEAFERARGNLLSTVATAAESADRALTDVELELDDGPTRAQALARVGKARGVAGENLGRTSASLAELDGAVRDLIDLFGAALVERDRLRVLLRVFYELDQATDLASFPPLMARLAARVLDADQVIVALEKDGELVALGRHGEPPGTDTNAWKVVAARAAMDGPGRHATPAPATLAARAQDNLAGPVFAVSLRRSGVQGVLYADKLRRRGQFREQDLAVAHLLADYAALSLGKLRARADEHLVRHQLAVTLDAIRDGVVAWDGRGVVTHVNATAARMLHVGPSELVGKARKDLPGLAPLFALSHSPARVEGAIVRLARGSFVVTCRPIAQEGDGGSVVSLVELARAEKLAQRLSATRARYGMADLIGESTTLEAAIMAVKRAATIDATVLITGESGTGKEVAAQAIHSSGLRAHGPFVGINCAALPRELLEAELFGYEKGAFTGARTQGNAGKFELATEGTILLDEIGDMPLDMQAKLLRVLQERTVTRLGGHDEIPVDARVIATTHRDLEALVDEGRFRMDLLFRLRVLAIHLPPLRERVSDIAELARHHLRRIAEQQRKSMRDLGPLVLEELERYAWPGNVRELANVMEAEVSLAPPDIVVLDRLNTRLAGRFRGVHGGGPTSTGQWRAANAPAPAEEAIVPLAEVEKRAYLSALERCHQNVARAAEALGVSKVTFYAKLRAWGLHPRGEGPSSSRILTTAPASSSALPDSGPDSDPK
jgi:transcriptional regulator with PAS, ATPase and Fis domain